MTSPLPWTAPFFVTGGTLAADAASYVERQSDSELFRWLRCGEFCYVLTARQMGKSSLMVRTASRLRDEGIGTLILDLTTLGQGVSPEQWYRGMLAITGEQLDLERELDEFWTAHRELGPLQRWFAALRQVVLARYPHGLVVFVDEIDAVRGLSFRPDDFFAAIRASANGYSDGPPNRHANGSAGARGNPSGGEADDAEDAPPNRPEARLTFCLLGVATPADLIRDTRNTPFNIGHRIELQDFTAAEAAVLAQGLSTPADRPPRDTHRLLERVLYWTAGQPYLSQRLCKAVADHPDLVAPRDVDRQCADLFFAPGALRRETHLLFAQELLLRGTDDVGGLLGFFARIRAGYPVRDDETNAFVSLLRLSGVVRVSRGRLRLRNRIYARIFDRTWVRDHLPEAERRRQRAAFRRGGLVVGAVGAAVGLLLASITTVALRNEKEAKRLAVSLRQTVRKLDQTVQERDLASRTQVGTLRRLRQALAGLTRANKTLLAQRGMIGQKAIALSRSQAQEHAERLAAENSGRVAATATVQAQAAARLAELRGAVARREMARLQADTGDNLVRESRFLEALPWFVAAARQDGDHAATGDAATLIHSLLAEGPRLLALWTSPVPISQARYSPDGRWLALVRAEGGLELRPASGGPPRLLLPADLGILAISFSPDSAHLLASSTDAIARIWDVSSEKPPVELAEKARSAYLNAVFVDQGRRIVTIEHTTGRIRLWDARTGRSLRDAGSVPGGPWVTLLPLGNASCVFVNSASRSEVLDLTSGAVAGIGPSFRGLTAASADGSLLAVADGLDVSIWQLPNLSRLGNFPISRSLKDLAFQPDGRLRTVGVDGTVQDWHPRTFQPLSEPVRLPGPIAVSALAPPDPGLSCGRKVFTIDPVGIGRTWDIVSGAERATFIRPPAKSGTPAFDATGKLVAQPGEDGWVRLVEAATGRSARTPLRAGYPLRCAAFSPDGAWLAVGGYGEPPRLWNLRTGVPHPALAPLTLLARQDGIEEMVFSPDGHRLLACRTDGRAQVYDLRNGRALPPVPCVHLRETPRPFSPDGRRLLLRSDASVNYSLFNIEAERLTQAAWLTGTGGHAEFSPDGRLIMAADDAHTLQLWHLPDARAVAGNLPRGERLNFATFSPDGRKILAIDTSTGAASLWDSHTFRPLLRPLLGRGVMVRAAFSPDGRRVVIASGNGDLEVWDTARGRLAAAPFNPRVDVGVELGPEKLHDLRFSADGSRVLAAFENGGAVVLPLDCGALPLSKLGNLTASLLGGAAGSAIAPAVLSPERVVQSWRQMGATQPAPAARAAEVRWHREQWRDCERAGLWEAAVGHLSRVIEAEPTSWQLRERRAQLQVQRQRWGEAAHDFQAALTHGSGHYLGYYWCALTQLAAGDQHGYHETCSGMLERFAADPRLRPRDLTAWTCALGPGRPADVERAIAVLKTMLQREPSNSSWRSTLGALLCRSGQFQEALAYLPPSGPNRSAALDDLFRALAYVAMGRKSEAHSTVAAAAGAITAGLRPGSPAKPSWEDRLEATVLLAEVEAKVGAKVPSASR